MASFKQIEKNNWEVSFYCKQYDGTNKKIKKRGFRTKKEANDYATNYVKKQNGAIDTMFFDVVDEFVEYKSRNVKYYTRINYRSFQKYIHKYFINKPINTITKRDIAVGLDKMKDIAYTQNYVSKKIKSVFEYANTYYDLQINPVYNLKYKTEKHVPKKKEIWILEEFEKFNEILKKKVDNLYRLYYSFLYFSGARLGEIAALTLEDIDFDKNNISISKTRLTAKLSNSTKNATSTRIVSIPTNLMIELKKALPFNFPKKEFIFYVTHAYETTLRNIIKENNLKKITLHGFRHSHASLLINKGVEITAISKRLGHANSQVTLSVYAHFYDEKKDEIIGILNDL